MVDHKTKLRDELMKLDALTWKCKRVLWFKIVEPGWDMDEKIKEIGELCVRCDLVMKMGKNLLSSLKKPDA